MTLSAVTFLREATTALWPVIGQARAISLLGRSLERAVIAHAYLLVGPDHVGKMKLALSLAQALNCQADEGPCGQCSSCQRIEQGAHADVQVIGLEGGNGESRSTREISIEHVRQLQYSASLAPFEGKYRIFIIDQADLLSLEAANALLKTLEEPVGEVVFILLTSDEAGIPDTVASRCQRLEIAPLAVAEVEQALYQRGQIDAQKAKLLARLSHGLIGWALLAAADERVLAEHTEIRDRILEVIGNGLGDRLAYAAELAGLFSKDRRKVLEILAIWLRWWHDLMLVRLGEDENISNIDRIEEMKAMASHFELRGIRGFIRKITQAEKQLKQNVSPRLAFEVMILNLPE